jgi:hypothetical protein
MLILFGNDCCLIIVHLDQQARDVLEFKAIVNNIAALICRKRYVVVLIKIG